MKILVLLVLCASALSLPVNEPSNSSDDLIQKVLDANPEDNDIELDGPLSKDVTNVSSEISEEPPKEEPSISLKDDESINNESLNNETMVDEYNKTEEKQVSEDPMKIDILFGDESLNTEAAVNDESLKEEEQVKEDPFLSEINMNNFTIEENNDAVAEVPTEYPVEENLHETHATAEVGDILFDPFIEAVEHEPKAEVTEENIKTMNDEDTPSLIDLSGIETYDESIPEEPIANDYEDSSIPQFEELPNEDIVPLISGANTEEFVPLEDDIPMETPFLTQTTQIEEDQPNFSIYRPIIMPDEQHLFAEEPYPESDYDEDLPLERIPLTMENSNTMENVGKPDLFPEQLDAEQDYDYEESFQRNTQEPSYSEGPIAENPLLMPLDTLPLEPSLIENIPNEENAEDVPLEISEDTLSNIEETEPLGIDVIHSENSPIITPITDFEDSAYDLIKSNDDQNEMIDSALEPIALEDEISNPGPILYIQETPVDMSFNTASDMDEVDYPSLPFSDMNDETEFPSAYQDQENFHRDPIFYGNSENMPGDTEMGEQDVFPHELVSEINRDSVRYMPNIGDFSETFEMPNMNEDQENLAFVPITMDEALDPSLSNNDDSYNYPSVYINDRQVSSQFNPYWSVWKDNEGFDKDIGFSSGPSDTNEENSFQQGWWNDNDFNRYFQNKNTAPMVNDVNNENDRVGMHNGESMINSKFVPFSRSVYSEIMYPSERNSPISNRDKSYSLNSGMSPRDIFKQVFVQELIKNLNSIHQPKNVFLNEPETADDRPIIVVIDPRIRPAEDKNNMPQPFFNGAEFDSETNTDMTPNNEQDESKNPMKTDDGVSLTDRFNIEIPYAPKFHHDFQFRPNSFDYQNYADYYSAPRQQQQQQHQQQPQIQQQQQQQSYDSDDDFNPFYGRFESDFLPFSHGDYNYYNRQYDTPRFPSRFRNRDNYMNYNQGSFNPFRNFFGRRHPFDFNRYY